MGICPHPAKVDAVADMMASEDVAEQRRLLGIANYSSPMIPNMADKTALSPQLLQNKTEWLWKTVQDPISYLKTAIYRNSCEAKYDPPLSNEYFSGGFVL